MPTVSKFEPGDIVELGDGSIYIRGVDCWHTVIETHEGFDIEMKGVRRVDDFMNKKVIAKCRL